MPGRLSSGNVDPNWAGRWHDLHSSGGWGAASKKIGGGVGRAVLYQLNCQADVAIMIVLNGVGVSRVDELFREIC